MIIVKKIEILLGFKEEVKKIMKKKLNKMRTLIFEEVMRVELIIVKKTLNKLLKKDLKEVMKNNLKEDMMVLESLIFNSVLVRLLVRLPPVLK